KPWQGNRLQQARQQLEALQLAIANQLASEQKASEQLLDDLEQRLQGAEGYDALDAAQKQQFSAPFAQAKQQLKGQKLIAVIRDQRNRFEDEQYPQLLLKLDQFARPKPVPAEQPSPSTQPENTKTLGADT
ncbi:BREX system P-loop protein BrxC, partial [Pseudomonas aeruginosa]|nr:BREX system P-loop protein BrxC [Pseudomonas aeruginosa]